ncbi:MAG: ComF family protein [Parvibaculales bacterium]
MTPHTDEPNGTPVILTEVLDFLLPPRCALCGVTVVQTPALCGSCWEGLTFIDGPVCARTGAPLPYDLGPQTVSLGAMMRPPAYDAARAAVGYDAAARDLIRRFKFNNRPELAALMVPWMHRAGHAILQDADFLLPVPLHWTRFLSRRYNQSAELARRLAHAAGVPMRIDLLKRVKRTRQQVGLTRPMRRKNLQGAFLLPKKQKPSVVDRHLVLVDDVLTTGATVEACAKVLRRAGAARVSVLTVARVVMPERVHI